MTRHRGELQAVRNGGRFGCNSFVAGTKIATPDGEVPIDALREGDLIIARHEADPNGRSVARRVSRVMSSEARCIVRVFLSDGAALSITEGHEVWTAERDWVSAYDLREGETVQTRDGSAAVIYVFASESPQTVYNLEFAGAFTYYANGVWVHNCGKYGFLTDPGGVGPGKALTASQRINILQANERMNGGVLRSDLSGIELVWRQGAPNSAHIDHMLPASLGGTNSYGNARVLSALENIKRGNRQ